MFHLERCLGGLVQGGCARGCARGRAGCARVVRQVCARLPRSRPYRAKNGSYGAKKLKKLVNKLKNRKINKPYIKVVLD